MIVWKFKVHKGGSSALTAVIEEEVEMTITEPDTAPVTIEHLSASAIAFDYAYHPEFNKTKTEFTAKICLRNKGGKLHWHDLKIVRTEKSKLTIEQRKVSGNDNYWYDGGIEPDRGHHHLKKMSHNGTWHGSGN